MIQRLFNNTRSVLSLLAGVGFSLVLINGCGSNSEPVPISKLEPSAAKLDAADIQLETETAIKKSPVDDEQRSSKPTKLAAESKPELESEDADSISPAGKAGSPAQPGETQEGNDSEQADSSSETTKTYTDAQLHKNLTTLLLAYQPDVRARHLIKFVRGQLTLDQEDEALRLLLRNDYHFQRLVRKREETLSAAFDGDDTPEKLRQIKIETVELSNRLRSLIYNRILTREQKEHRQKVIEESRLAKKLEAEKKRKR